MSYNAKIRADAMSLNPIDDALFVKMAESLKVCQEMLRIFLRDNQLIVLDNVPQSIVKNLQGRSCILDLKCRLSSGKIVHIEVQKADDDDHQRRVRYNSSLLTSNIADPGTKFRDIPDVISVFISKFDVFKRGKAVYHVERIIKETGDKVYNGTQEIYINAEIDDNSDIAKLMKVFVEDSYYDDKFPATSERKRIFKTTEEGVNEMCEVIERNRAEARAEGRAEGRVEGQLSLLTKLVKLNKLTLKEAADAADMTEANFRKLALL
ncbi:MAG: PD-(D/E)XK nuclease family transposase [Selenomonadaceae bacterium]|nr:PD-(D/E)XK nuclease family transposase [Selenomonadaceae bacterium]